ncbi:MAG: Fe-S protein assembly co-chaperone HscB [Legionellales bacterium]|nr:Fe-S protein assembly co-chaperone HscB [Legionellales bacterium]|tara:strand:+ start:9 stop:530 length:522 start_codon:yes stop_codon:yes gene_type:complete
MTAGSRQNNPFKLMGLPIQYAIDIKALEATYRQLMQHYHPDNYVSEPMVVRKSAVQMSTRINDAMYQLRSPLSRAITWMNLHGLSKDNERGSSLGTDFLMEQMRWRERIADADADQVCSIQNEILEKLQSFESEFESLSVDEEKIIASGWELIEKWQFFEKLAKVVKEKGESL